MELMNAKGTRDFGPEDKILRNDVVDKLTTVFERYGFSPLETPIFERMDLLNAKSGAGDESDAVKETFKFKDQGNRELGLRFELTLSFSRYIGMNPTIKLPFKRYELGPVFRDGPIKLGRYRQFWQCDVDVVGSKNMAVDAEILTLAIDTFKELKLDAYLEVNNRKILRGIIEFAGIKPSLSDSVIISIDKLNKIGKDEVRKELEQKKIDDSAIAKLLSAFDVSGSNEEKLNMLKGILQNDVGREGVKELEEVLSLLPKGEVEFNVTLARGLAYYTGTIFEGFMNKSKVTSSICGGGRYDEMIPKLLGTDKEYPAIGISFGLDVINDVLKLENASVKKTVADVYIIPIKTTKECFKIAQKLRNSSIKVDLDIVGRGISKNLDFANSLEIPYVIFVGQKELDAKKLTLRDMKSGKESSLSVEDLIKKLK